MSQSRQARIGKWVEIIAVAMMAVMAAIILVAVIRSYGEPARAEIGTVLRFGNRPDDRGDQPSVIVRAADGQQVELTPSPAVLRGCKAGDRIGLVRRGYRLQVGLRGCF